MQENSKLDFNKVSKVNDIFLRYTMIVVKSFCCGCYADVLGRRSEDHHNGRVNTFFRNDFNSSFDKYLKDVEHGFFHGLIVGFVAVLYKHEEFLLSDDSIFLKELEYNVNGESETLKEINELIFSSLLHDFLKCYEYPQEEHDSKLEKFFPNLLKETYTHSKPTNEIHPLIVGDRTELKRYTDYHEWIDESKFKHSFNDSQKEVLEIFYKMVRPALLSCYNLDGNSFIRRGIESGHPFGLTQEDSWPVKDHCDVFSIEVDCSLFQCSLHHSHSEWGHFFGLMSIKKYKRLGGRIGQFKDIATREDYQQWVRYINPHTMDRDHLFADKKTSPKHWTFLYRYGNKTAERISAIDETFKFACADCVINIGKIKNLVKTRIEALSLN